MKKLNISIFIVLLFPVISWASFNSAMSSYEQKDYYAASSEFKTLAANGDSDAQYMLGYLYATGKGVLKDYIEAHKWFNLSASYGNNDAIKARTGIERNMTREQIALAQSRAREWSPGTHKTPVLTMDDLQETPVPVVEIRDKNTVRQVQQQLIHKGYRPGPADGAIGSNTRKAIAQYQQDNHLPVNSKVTQTLVDSLFPDGLIEQVTQVNNVQGLLFPEIWQQTDNSVDSVNNYELLVQQLDQLLQKGRQRRAAQSWFLNDLSALIKPKSTQWSNFLLDDNFNDGNYSQSPQWSILSGHFSVRENSLYSHVIAQSSPDNSPSSSKKDFSTALLGAILDHALKDKKKSEVSSSSSDFAKIITQQKIPASFALKAKLTLQNHNGRIEFGPYATNDQQQGYQLSIIPEHNQIELLRINARGSSVIESTRKNIAINQAHVFEWIKDDSSMITLAMDGERLFQVSDRSYQNGFAGFMLNNFSGSMLLHEITIVGN